MNFEEEKQRIVNRETYGSFIIYKQCEQFAKSIRKIKK